MRFKKILGVGVAAVMATSMLSGLTACGGKESFTVWCPEEAVTLTTKQINDYIEQQEALGEEFPYNVVVEAVGEGEAATNMVTDVTAGADIYFFAQDQLARLIQAGALSPVSSSYATAVKSNNDGGSVAAASVDDTLYAYPLTSDNGYFMYYDKSVLSEDDIKDQTTIISVCEAAGKQIGFQLSNSGWYSASYFFATGCVSEWTADSSGAYTEYNDTFKSEKGVIAVKGMAELIGSDAYVGSDSAEASLFESGAAVVVSGTWDYNTALKLLGDNLGCAKLWSFTVDGESYQLGSFSGNKLLGVKPQTDADKAVWAQALANYLTGETCQAERFDSLAWGPSNTNAQASDAVQANPALAALAAQSEYATPQGQYPNAWWDASKAIGANIEALNTTTVTTEQAEAVLATYKEALDSIMAAVTELVVVGSMNGWTVTPDEASYYLNYETNTYASKSESDPLVGTWSFEVTLEAGGMFRVCSSGWNTYAGYSNLDTANSYSGLTANDDDNIVVNVAGTYSVVLDHTGSEYVITVTLKA